MKIKNKKANHHARDLLRKFIIKLYFLFSRFVFILTTIEL